MEQEDKIREEAMNIKLLRRTISMESMKKYAREKLPINSVLRDVIVHDDDYISPAEMLGKISIWMRLLEREK